MVKISNSLMRAPSGPVRRALANACTGPYTSSTVNPSNSATATLRTDVEAVMRSLPIVFGKISPALDVLDCPRLGKASSLTLLWTTPSR